MELLFLTFRDKAYKQIHEDFNLARELSLKEAWKPLPADPVIETDEYGACSSKSVMNSVLIPNVSNSNSTTELDDAAIAQILQAEYDLEFDGELKKIEQNRNKSNVVKFFMIHHFTCHPLF